MVPPLRLAYIITVHKLPTQLNRLLQRLYTPGTQFYIHVDAKANLTSFRAAVTFLPSHSLTWITQRKTVSWGGFSLTDVYLHCLDVVLKQQPEPDFILFISGQDYPIATNESLHTWLAAHIDHTIIDHTLIDEDAPHILERVQTYYLSIKPHRTITYPVSKPNKLTKRVFDTALRISGLFPFPRTLPLGHQLYFGTNWFQLKPVAARYVLKFVQANPGYVQFARTTFVPEEHFFHTILLNSPDLIRRTLLSHRLTFMQWDRPEGSYPIPLSVDDFPAMIGSGKFFARKFDETYDKAVFDQIDEFLDSSATT